MRLRRSAGPGRRLPLVPLVDVLLILLVFFMVTSRYENLGMVPLVTAAEPPALAAAGEGGSGRPILLLRLAPDGSVHAPGGRGPLVPAALEALLSAAGPARVRVLAAPEARTAALVALVGIAARAEVADLRVLRVEPQQ